MNPGMTLQEKELLVFEQLNYSKSKSSFKKRRRKQRSNHMSLLSIDFVGTF
jgi:hypothetical protein